MKTRLTVKTVQKLCSRFHSGEKLDIKK